MRSFTLVALICVLGVIYPASAIHMDRIKCKVCDRAIAHIWNQGDRLRQHCASHGNDPRCNRRYMHRHGVDEMTQDVCDDLPKTHQSLITDEDFELEAHDDPSHEPVVLQAIRDACVRWVHDEHSVESVSRIIYANLDAGKRTQHILHKIQEQYCHAACKADDHVYTGVVEDDGPQLADL